MKLDDWIALYERKAEKYTRMEGFEMYFLPEKGFLTYRVENKVLWMGDCCGDAAWIYEWCRSKAKEQRCALMATYTKRNPKAFLRMAYKLGSHAHFEVQGSRYLANRAWYWLLTEVVE